MPVTWLGKMFPVCYVNGQCIIGPPNGARDPIAGCEVFVSRIPRSFGPDELIPILSYAGSIFTVRLLMNFDGSNRGVAFAKYTTRRGAKEALKLNALYVQIHHKIRVQPSLDVRCVWMRNINSKLNIHSVVEKVQEISQVRVQRLDVQSSNGRGTHALLTFRSNADAIVALRSMSTSKYMFGPLCQCYMQRIR